MPNIQWKKPHAVFFGETILLPGENGNSVTQDQLAALEGDKTFRDCKRMGLVVIAEDAEIVEAPAADTVAKAPAERVLRTDGPTLKQFKAQGYAEEGYPPEGYAVRVDAEADAKMDTDVEAKAQAEAEAQAKAAADAMKAADDQAKADGPASDSKPAETPAAPAAAPKAEAKKKG